MSDMEMQSSMSWYLPPEGEALSQYLTAVGQAVRARSDADLATVIGVPPTTVANWKRRGRVPADQLVWFANDLFPEIAARNQKVPQTGGLPIGGVIRFIRRSGGNPWGVADDEADVETGTAFSALVAVAVLALHTDRSIGAMDDDAALNVLAERIEAVLPMIVKSRRIGVYQ